MAAAPAPVRIDTLPEWGGGRSVDQFLVKGGLKRDLKGGFKGASRGLEGGGFKESKESPSES